MVDVHVSQPLLSLYVCVLLPLEKSLDFTSVWSILFSLNVLKGVWDSVTQY